MLLPRSNCPDCVHTTDNYFSSLNYYISYIQLSAAEEPGEENIQPSANLDDLSFLGPQFTKYRHHL